MLHRLFDQHKGINLYPVDLSVLYAYFPFFTNNKTISDVNLKTRLNHVIKSSLEEILTNNKEIEELITQFLSVFDKIGNNINLRSKKDVINGISKAWISSKNNPDKSLPFVFKETSQAIYFEYFKNRFPDLQMVCLIRDPRDNFSSIKSGVEKYYSRFGEDANIALSSLINRVRMDYKSALNNQEAYPDSFLAIRYEDLVTEPKKLMQTISNFLDIEFSESMLIPTIMGQDYFGNNFEGIKFKSISSKQVGKWKQRISEKEAMIIEYWLEDLMTKWGYEIEFSNQQKQSAFIEFYEWYNSKYFYKDSFVNK